MSSVVDPSRIKIVEELEKERVAKGFKPGWLFYRCKEKGILPELEFFQSQRKPPLEPCDPSSPRLSIELVPETSWFSNVRSHVSEEDWKLIRKEVARAANYRCEICGGRGPQWPVECHERWIYDDETHTQTLEGFIALCPDCHEVKHIGYANTQGRTKEALATLQKVNNWDEVIAQTYVDKQFEKWVTRSKFEWILDLSLLDSTGIEVSPTAKQADYVSKEYADEIVIFNEELVEREFEAFYNRPSRKEPYTTCGSNGSFYILKLLSSRVLITLFVTAIVAYFLYQFYSR